MLTAADSRPLPTLTPLFGCFCPVQPYVLCLKEIHIKISLEVEILLTAYLAQGMHSIPPFETKAKL